MWGGVRGAENNAIEYTNRELESKVNITKHAEHVKCVFHLLDLISSRQGLTVRVMFLHGNISR